MCIYYQYKIAPSRTKIRFVIYTYTYISKTEYMYVRLLGAFRMRGIGAGQRIHLYVIPEVADLLRRELIAAGGDAVRAMRRELDNHQTDIGGAEAGHNDNDNNNNNNNSNNNDNNNHVTSRDTVLQDVVAWLVVNSMRSEQTQWSMLCLQNISNIYRKNAFRRIHNGINEFLSTKPDDENKFLSTKSDDENKFLSTKPDDENKSPAVVDSNIVPVCAQNDGDKDEAAALSTSGRETRNSTSTVLQGGVLVLDACKGGSVAGAKIGAKALTVHIDVKNGEDAGASSNDVLVRDSGRDIQTQTQTQTQTAARIDSSPDKDFDARIDALPLRRSLAVFSEPIDHSLEAAVPDPIPFEDKLRGMLDAHDAFLLRECEHAVGLSVLQEVGQFALLGDSANRLDTEQEREQEQEQEKEVKARRDQQVGLGVVLYACMCLFCVFIQEGGQGAQRHTYMHTYIHTDVQIHTNNANIHTYTRTHTHRSRSRSLSTESIRVTQRSLSHGHCLYCANILRKLRAISTHFTL
jgi:hypothetical protein